MTLRVSKHLNKLCGVIYVNFYSFLARDSMLSALYAIARPSVCLSVRLSVTRVDQSKTVERIIEILSPSDSFSTPKVVAYI